MTEKIVRQLTPKLKSLVFVDPLIQSMNFQTILQPSYFSYLVNISDGNNFTLCDKSTTSAFDHPVMKKGLHKLSNY